VEIIGTAQNPRIRLYSEPDMSESDKLSWLLLGRGPTGLGRTELALVQQAALALLSGDDNTGGNPVLSQLGIDELSIRQDEGATGTQDTVVSLGKQLSSRWYVGYERSLNATTGTWQLIYRLAQRVTLRAQSGLDNALDVIWTWRWQ
jgi:translocation and assembly module TamB